MIRDSISLNQLRGGGSVTKAKELYISQFTVSISLALSKETTIVLVKEHCTCHEHGQCKCW